LRILYLEDTVADAQIVERYIQLTDHEVTIAHDIASAWAKFADVPDLILVDVLLNKSRSGYDFVREVRAKGYDKPIVAVTGLSFSADIQECYNVGCNEVLIKPYAIKQLVELFGKYLS